MFKTLGWLVASMTIATALLGWADPSNPHAPMPLAPDQIMRLARARVAEAPGPAADRWDRVEITAGMAVSHTGTLRAPATAPSDAHFIVDDDGRPHCAASWHLQEPADGADDAVRIEVRRRRVGGPMTAAQWLCVRSLIRALNDRAANSDVSLPVRLHPAWSQVYGIEDDALLTLAADTAR